MQRPVRALLPLLLLVGQAEPAQAAQVQADLQVRLEPEQRMLAGRGTWLLPPGGPWRVVLDERFELRNVTVDGAAITPAARNGNGLHDWQLPADTRQRRLAIEWRGRPDATDAALDHRAVLTHVAPVSGARGSFLPAAANWHPVVAGAALAYRIELDVPASQHAIVPGQLLSERVADGRRVQTYAFEQPEPAIDLMAGPYRVTQESYRSIDGRMLELRSLMHEEVADRAAGDLAAVGRYLRLYESWIGPYPYQSFSIVSSPTPTGFGMPTLTYLGVDVLRLPFIRDTSLGHEVLHNWWGNGVRPDYTRGNWSEGLTTFMADYTYREQAGGSAALETRLAWLRDFAALGGAPDAPLAQFTSRTHGAGQVTGYNKAAMVFLMLRDLVGTEAFDAGLRLFWQQHRGRIASWQDLRAAFERTAQRDLHGFFAQWLERSGAPDLRLESAAVRRDGAGWRVEVALTQQSPAYRLRVPLQLEQADGRTELQWVEVERSQVKVVLHTDRPPQHVLLDPQARVFRRLGPGEAPPILRQAMLDPATRTVLAGAAGAGEGLARRLVEHPLQLQPASAAPPPQPLLLIGLAHDVDDYLERNRLPPRPAELSRAVDTATAWVWTAERPDAAPLTVVAARNEQALAALARPLPHYGRQSWLVFNGGTALARGIWPSRPQAIALTAD